MPPLHDRTHGALRLGTARAPSVRWPPWPLPSSKALRSSWDKWTKGCVTTCIPRGLTVPWHLWNPKGFIPKDHPTTLTVPWNSAKGFVPTPKSFIKGELFLIWLADDFFIIFFKASLIQFVNETLCIVFADLCLKLPCFQASYRLTFKQTATRCRIRKSMFWWNTGKHVNDLVSDSDKGNGVTGYVWLQAVTIMIMISNG